MSTDAPKFTMNVRVRLSGMMFLQYMLFAVWWVPLAAYLNNLGFTSYQQAGILSTMALGCLLSPIVGMIADRYMASQLVLCFFNLVSGGLLFWASKQTNPTTMFYILLVQQLCYMPTWGLTNSIAMANSPSDKFPAIRAFGSFGWVAAAIFSLFGTWFFSTTIDGTSIPMAIGAILCIVAGLHALTLPNTPPPAKGKKASVIDALGLRAATLMKDFHFTVFMLIAILMMIPFVLYFSFGSRFLSDQGFKMLTLSMNLGQFGEIFFMLLIPLVLKRMGLKWALAVGLLAMLVRYVAFLLGYQASQEWLYYVAILVHGLIFGFFFVGGQMYIDKRAPKEIQASAQGFFFLMTFAIGMYAGTYVSGYFLQTNSTTNLAVPAGYTLPDHVHTSADMITAKGFNASDIKLYDRVLNGTETALLSADEKKAKFLKDSTTDTIAMDKGLLYSGGNLKDLAATHVPKQFTFSAKYTTPANDEATKDDDALSGVLFSIGSGEKAMTIAIDSETGYLTYTAGDQTIEARTITIPRRVIPKDKAKIDPEAKDATIYIGGTFDGEKISLLVNGGAYVMTDWGPILNISTIFSLVLLVLFVILFNDPIAKKPGGEGGDAPEAATAKNEEIDVADATNDGGGSEE